METSDKTPKKPKRSFVEAWLTDERYKHWIRKVSFDETLYYCSICNENFSCSTSHVSRHANSVSHRNNMKENTSSNDDNVTDDDVENKTPSKSAFKTKWLDRNDYKLWLREVPHDKNMCFCTVCDKSFVACLTHIRRHAESKSHLHLCEVRAEANEFNDDFTTQENESLLLFNERKKSAETQYAALIAEKNIPSQTAQEVLNFFQHVGQEDPKVLKSMSMGRTKCKNIISNVLCPVESEQIVNKLQKTKFFVFIDETFDSCNERWMTFFVRYVDPETLDIRSQLVKLINIGKEEEPSGEKLFDAFECEMLKLKIPFSNVVALSFGNSSVITKKHLTFQSKMKEMCTHLLVFPCPCSSATLAVRAACSKIPSFCSDFLKRIASYIDSSPKRSAVFRVFCDCFQDKSKSLKLSEIHWLSHYSCIEKLLELWDKIKYFLQESVEKEKSKIARGLLSMMDNLEMKAYFLFLKFILHSFNKFKAFFQSTETKIHLLQLKSVDFLSQICENFVKKKYQKDVTNIMLSNTKFQKDTNEIFVGLECEQYLKNLMIEDYVDVVSNVRRTCLQFYLTAAKEIRKRLPITHNFLEKLQVFGPSKSLFGDNRETSFQNVSFIAKTLGLDGLDEKSLKEEWLSLPTDFTMEEKQNLSKLNFDNLWKKILQRELSSNTYKYPNLRNVLGAIRSLPNSNVDSEKMFVILIDLKTQKRNKLSTVCINATCVIKSALKTRGETALNMTVTQEHLSRMSSDKLYAYIPEKESSLPESATDEIVGSSSTTK